MKQELVNFFLDKGYLLGPDFFADLKEDFDKEIFIKYAEEKFGKGDNPLVLHKDLFSVVNNERKEISINWIEFEKARTLFEKKKKDVVYNTFLDVLNYGIQEDKKKKIDSMVEALDKPSNDFLDNDNGDESSVVILKSYGEDSGKREVQDFVSYFKARYNFLREILQKRPELNNVISISRVVNKKYNEPVSIIGIVSEKHITKNDNIILTIEDPTGIVKVLFNKNREIYRYAQETVNDEVIGINGFLGNGIIFGNDLFFPDIPLTKEVKKSPDETYAAFISDLHVGSNLFLKKDFMRFINWINLKTGNSKQKKIASKVKYLFIMGDLIDGVGIYPGQEDELYLKTIEEQYAECAKLLQMIRKDIKIIISPGNHDTIRVAEPQPVFDKERAKPLFELNNAFFVSNPAFVNIHSSQSFVGFDVLIYHGYSYDFYGESVETIRLARPNISERVDLIMKLLLQKRHLAPSHTSTLYIPYKDHDPLVVDKIPDFFISGHIHKLSISSYNNVTLISGSCWQSRTDFQERTGHSPDPSRVPLVNLKTREIKVLNFLSEKNE